MEEEQEKDETHQGCAEHTSSKYPLHRSLQAFILTAGSAPLEDNRLRTLSCARTSLIGLQRPESHDGRVLTIQSRASMLTLRLQPRKST
eukprot:3097227-Pyramimonas_sp.AAC.3